MTQFFSGVDLGYCGARATAAGVGAVLIAVSVLLVSKHDLFPGLNVGVAGLRVAVSLMTRTETNVKRISENFYVWQKSDF